MLFCKSIAKEEQIAISCTIKSCTQMLWGLAGLMMSRSSVSKSAAEGSVGWPSFIQALLSKHRFDRCISIGLHSQRTSILPRFIRVKRSCASSLCCDKECWLSMASWSFLFFYIMHQMYQGWAYLSEIAILSRTKQFEQVLAATGEMPVTTGCWQVCKTSEV